MLMLWSGKNSDCGICMLLLLAGSNTWLAICPFAVVSYLYVCSYGLFLHTPQPNSTWVLPPLLLSPAPRLH